MGASAVCDKFLEGDDLHPFWFFTQVKFGSFWVLNQITVSPFVLCHSAISPGGLRGGLVHCETSMVFGFALHASAAEKEIPGRPSSYLVRKAKR